MILEHYSDQIIQHFSDQSIQQETRSCMKPLGFWVSVKGADDWPTWCTNEQFSLDRLALCHKVTLADDENILLIDTLEKLDDFDRTFSHYSLIRWQTVANTYDGIIIAPYQWERRLSLQWYYGWDCASGCIWNLRAITSVEISQ